MKKPDFFIIGAPKCATTSMAAWLSMHPNVFMSPLKEPHHFDSDHLPGIKDRSAYERLFTGADDQHIRVGEASVRYLHSKVAVKNILSYTTRPKFIAMVRNPVSMAQSLHEQHVFSLNEDVDSFEEAWKLQATRADGHKIPPMCNDPQHLQYGDFCKLGEQLERVLALAPREDILIIFMDDIIKDAHQVYDETVKFLGLPPHRPAILAKRNSAKTHRSKHLAALLRLAVGVKSRMGMRAKPLGLASRISQWNRVERPRPMLSPAVREELYNYFSNDIKILSDITGRDLSHWR